MRRLGSFSTEQDSTDLYKIIGRPAYNLEMNSPCGPLPGYLQSPSRGDLTIRLGLCHKLLVDSHRVLILSQSVGVHILGVSALGSILTAE